jgi:hypothetical protein
VNTVRGDEGGGVAVRGRGTWLTHWVSDLRLGVRLAIGGGRTSKTGIVRLVLGTVGLGLAVAVLLVAASAGPLFSARTDREGAQFASSEPIPGVDPLYARSGSGSFRGRGIDGVYLRRTGPNSPLPPGVGRLPGDGEIVVSPALAALLASPEGELLRPRFPQRIIGTIGTAGVIDANALSFYAGDSTLGEERSTLVYAYGVGGYERPMPPELLVLIAIGTVVLLMPVLVFVGTSARIAGAERDRRLAALRLVGADAQQARRIAAAESLVSAVTGLAFGVGLFLVFRSLVGSFPILGVSAYPGDVVPPWPLVVLIVVLVPLLAVATAQLALRRTIIEPLGVVRRSRPARRRLWWRLVPAAGGPALLLIEAENPNHNDTWLPLVITGAALLLLSIPALLPWLMERVVARLHGGRPAAQLAIRRLQLDSGTPARVVAGVAVVLAGAIALQAVLVSQTARYDRGYERVARAAPDLMMTIEDDVGDDLIDTVRAVPGVDEVIAARQFLLRVDGNDGNGNDGDGNDGDGMFAAGVVDCAVVLRYFGTDGCTDGDVFRTDRSPRGLVPGRVVTMIDYHGGPDRPAGKWTLPATIRDAAYGTTDFDIGTGALLITPGALRGVRLTGVTVDLAIRTDAAHPDVLEHVRNAVAPLRWRAQTYTLFSLVESSTVQLYTTIRGALLGGSLFTLLLAGLSMLVLALEQVRERRRPLAALAATGVPTATLARSLLWQYAIPVLLAVLVAIAAGVGLAWLVFGLVDEPFFMDWPSVALFSAMAAALVILVTVLTLPTLRSATRLTALRTE